MKDADIKDTIYIPKSLLCGFRWRDKNDWYTKDASNASYKVAFVTYFDNKNKLRHETSLNSWKDNSITNEEYKNVPTRGFKVFKKPNIQGNRFCEYRNVALEIQDPRGWVFEITTENLMWILDNSTITKGEISGEFVYGWDSSKRVLIPCSSNTYKDITKYSDIIENNKYISPKDLKVNHLYKAKDGEVYIYLGRHDVYKHSITAKSNNDRDTEYWLKNGYKETKVLGTLSFVKCEKTHNAYMFASLDTVQNNFIPIFEYKNPRNKFIGEMGEFTDEKALSAIGKKMEHDFKYHYIDWTKEYKRYLTKADIDAYFDNYVRRNNANFGHYGLEIPFYCGNFDKRTRLEISIDVDGKRRYVVRKMMSKYVDYVIDLDKWVAENQPYIVYNIMDNGVDHYMNFYCNIYYPDRYYPKRTDI